MKDIFVTTDFYFSFPHKHWHLGDGEDNICGGGEWRECASDTVAHHLGQHHGHSLAQHHSLSLNA